MKLTERQIECQRLWAWDKFWFWCILWFNKEDRAFWIQISREYKAEDKTIVVFVADWFDEIDCKKHKCVGFWKPIDYWRLCYLMAHERRQKGLWYSDKDIEKIEETFAGIEYYLKLEYWYTDKDILERPPRLVDMVYRFLKALSQ